MGDHRANVECKFEMHGHKAEQKWWINWDTNGCDERIIEWFKEQNDIAMSKYESEMAEYWRKQNAEKLEAQERAQLKILQEKYGEKA